MFLGFISAALGCLLVGLSLRFATRKAFQGQAPNPLSLVFIVVYRVFFAASILFLCLSSFSCFGFIIALFIIEAVILTYSTRFRLRRESLLSLITLSTEHQLPLGPLVDAWQTSSGLNPFNAESRLVELIAQGVPLHAALGEVPAALPGSASVYVRAGAATGAVAPAFRAAIEQENQNFAFRRLVRNSWAYFTIVPLIIFSILSFVMIKIIPAFKKIFDDFGLLLPRTTQALIMVSDWLVNYGVFLLLPGMLIWGAILLFTLGGNLVARVTYWFQPGVRALNITSFLRLLAVVVEQKQPLRPAVELLVFEHPHLEMRNKMQSVLRDLDGGADWCESLRRVKLIGKSDVALLHSAQRLGNLPWALRQTADSLARRTMFRLEALMKVVFPMLVIALGLCVGMIVIALFIPLIKLIASLVG